MAKKADMFEISFKSGGSGDDLSMKSLKSANETVDVHPSLERLKSARGRNYHQRVLLSRLVRGGRCGSMKSAPGFGKTDLQKLPPEKNQTSRAHRWRNEELDEWSKNQSGPRR